MKCVAVFASNASLAQFRVDEFLCVAQLLDVPVNLVEGVSWLEGEDSDCFFVFSCDAVEKLPKVASRCVLLRGIYVLLQTAPSLEDLYNRHKAGLCPPPTIYVGEEENDFSEGDFCYSVETVGRRYSGEAKAKIIDELLQTSKHNTKGRVVNYKNPHVRFVVFVQHATQEAPVGAPKDWMPNGPVLRVLHCVSLVESQRNTMLAKYDLKKRPYIGTTSMPPEESLLMSNFGRVGPGSLVFDPFCGTGSLLVAAAHYGGRTIGADADGRAMRCGTTKGKTSPQLVQQRKLALATYQAEVLAKLTSEEQELPDMLTNFKVYGLCPPDRIRMNFSAWQKSWHLKRAGDGSTKAAPQEGFLDAIVTDPPYGLREPRKKVVQDEDGKEITGAVAAYDTHEMVLDLVLFAAECLIVGGYLTFWHPTTDQYQDDELPSHPSMRIITNIPQRVSLKVVRRLIVMRKHEPLPAVRPTRAACAPRRPTEDLRKLHDETHLPDNKDYTEYREKLARKREAIQKYWEQNGEENTRRRRVGDKQEEIVSNREKKIRLREEKQKESHRMNARNASKGETNE